MILFRHFPNFLRRSGDHAGAELVKIKGTVILTKNSLNFNVSFLNRRHAFIGSGVSFQLISSTVADPNLGGKGRVGKVAYLENWSGGLESIDARESRFDVNFEWDLALGIPGAVIVKNNHHKEFYLRSLTLEEDVSGEMRNLNGIIVFDCNSWVYPIEKYDYDRVFFVNNTYLPGDMPATLKGYREDELRNLRGDKVKRQLQEWDRVYGYAYYNDLGEDRPVLGGSLEYPYPRRGRTCRPSIKTGLFQFLLQLLSGIYKKRPDPKSERRESRLPFLKSLDIYVPRDEKFDMVKMSDFLGYALKSVGSAVIPGVTSVLDGTPNEFDSFDDVLGLYDGGIKIPSNDVPLKMVRELLRSDGEQLFKFPTPQVIQDCKSAWRSDEEFGREMLAGLNPVIISRLEVFPPVSQLGKTKYGDQTSKITGAHIAKFLDGMSVEDAIGMNKLYILNHHDTLLPYLNRINSTGNKIYATRTLLFLKSDGTLKPIAIELGLPHPDGDIHGFVSEVFTPKEGGVEGTRWQLAKAYAAVNDSGVHQLISHWLNTHAVIEPFVIATNRRLSVVHPIHKLLNPHYRDTMNINALARQILINAGGILEITVFPGKYAMEMSSAVYKSWKLTDHALPTDLLKRGVAVKDPDSESNVKLLIDDYPYAVDGLAIWNAIEEWAKEYCNIYYPSDAVVKNDVELQAWWKEVREEGHGDKKNETWWPEMNCVDNLISTSTTLIWISSALHAAVNFGQYAYAGYLPNRPTISRRFMPEPGSPEYAELETNPEGAFLKTITSEIHTILGVSLIEILSKYSSDEVYLGQRASAEWTSDKRAVAAFKKFGEKLEKIESRITAMNSDPTLKNRSGPVNVPYTLLYPSTSDDTKVGGLTGKGIPNSVSM
ncbi:Lipoxygenase (potentially 9-LOX) [Zostera marina]|uniref:Lipoxygenase n=1 Tax=Zostera marina TaxID=29655 RepID=A0A0K9Q0D4_ZOSMR|nr:Lipoxygenase (potentially 9-LOX) [Zostera marina]